MYTGDLRDAHFDMFQVQDKHELSIHLATLWFWAQVHHPQGPLVVATFSTPIAGRSPVQ